MKAYNETIKSAAKLTALSYLTNVKHGDRYWFAMTVSDGAGVHGAKRKLVLACVDRQTMVEVVQHERILEPGFWNVVEQG